MRLAVLGEVAQTLQEQSLVHLCAIDVTRSITTRSITTPAITSVAAPSPTPQNQLAAASCRPTAAPTMPHVDPRASHSLRYHHPCCHPASAPLMRLLLPLPLQRQLVQRSLLLWLQPQQLSDRQPREPHVAHLNPCPCQHHRPPPLTQAVATAARYRHETLQSICYGLRFLLCCVRFHGRCGVGTLWGWSVQCSTNTALQGDEHAGWQQLQQLGGGADCWEAAQRA